MIGVCCLCEGLGRIVRGTTKEGWETTRIGVILSGDLDAEDRQEGGEKSEEFHCSLACMLMNIAGNSQFTVEYEC